MTTCTDLWEIRYFRRRPAKEFQTAFCQPPARMSGQGFLHQAIQGFRNVVTAGASICGTWKCGPDRGRWRIAMRRGGEAADGVEDVIEIGLPRCG